MPGSLNLARVYAGRFEPRENTLCDWCEFQELCPVFRHREEKRNGDPTRQHDRDRRRVDRAHVPSAREFRFTIDVEGIAVSGVIDR